MALCKYNPDLFSEVATTVSLRAQLPHIEVDLYKQSPTTFDIFVHELPDADTELFKQCLQISTHELPNVNATLIEHVIVHEAVSPATFPKFADLPRELRIKIWRLQFPAARSVNLDCAVYETIDRSKVCNDTTPEVAFPITLYINHESRQETLRCFAFHIPQGRPYRYRYTPEVPFPLEPQRCALFINPTQDMVHLNGGTIWSRYSNLSLEWWATNVSSQQLRWMYNVEQQAGERIFNRVRTVHICHTSRIIHRLLEADNAIIRSLPIFRIISYIRGMRKLIITFEHSDDNPQLARVGREESMVSFKRLVQILEDDFKSKIDLVSGGTTHCEEAVERGMRIAGLLKGKPSQE